MYPLGNSGRMGAVGQTGGQDFPHRRATFPLEEAAGELAGRGEPLAVVDRQGEEVLSGAGGAGLCGNEKGRLAIFYENGPVCLLCHFTGGEGEGLPPDFAFNRDLHSVIPNNTLPTDF